MGLFLGSEVRGYWAATVSGPVQSRHTRQLNIGSSTGGAARVTTASIWANDGLEETGTGGGPSSTELRLGIGGCGFVRDGDSSASWCFGRVGFKLKPRIGVVFITDGLGGNLRGCASSWGSGIAGVGRDWGFAGRDGSLGGRLGFGAGRASVLRTG